MRKIKDNKGMQLVIIIAVVYAIGVAVFMAKIDRFRKTHGHVSTGHPHHEAHNHKGVQMSIGDQIARRTKERFSK